jgi:hypothetical protein
MIEKCDSFWLWDLQLLEGRRESQVCSQHRVQGGVRLCWPNGRIGVCLASKQLLRQLNGSERNSGAVVLRSRLRQWEGVEGESDRRVHPDHREKRPM